MWESIRHQLVVMLREQDSKAPSSSAVIVDTQSVKTTGKKPCGYDAAKKVKGRKRHVAVDTSGLLLV